MPLLPPRISGIALRALAQAARSSVGSRAIYEVLHAELGLDLLASLPESLRGSPAFKAQAIAGRPPRVLEDAKLAPPASATSPWSGTSQSLTARYRQGSLSPTDHVSRALAAARELAQRTPTYGPLLEYGDTEALKEAEAATERYRRKTPRGPLDGVPFAVKEELSVRGFARQGGTAIIDRTPCDEDATIVARLRAEGAIVLGTTPMTEYGLSPIGHNSRRKMPRNPHGVAHAAGGSSTGSAVAVATGLVPFALGGDGGGSIRIPAAICGVFGLKPTWGRVSRFGDMYSGSVEHLGPIASSTQDLALALERTAGQDPRDADTSGIPATERGAFVQALGRGVKKLRIGVPEAEWADAHPQVAAAGRAALRALETAGAVLEPVECVLMPFAVTLGFLILGIEAVTSLERAMDEHRGDLSADTAVTLSALRHVPAHEFLRAQKLRAGLRMELARIFQRVDVIALPTTARTALSLSEGEWESGLLDSKGLQDLCRFAFLANLTGHPAGTAPVGVGEEGMPVGLQIIGDAWDEATVLATLAHLERIGAAEVRKPAVSVKLQSSAQSARP